MKVNTLTLGQGGYPERLRHIVKAPKTLYYLGNIDALQGPTLSVVGSRKVSPYGQQVTTQLTTAVAQAGVTIVSGLALGVDSLAHRAALDAGAPTIAVLPGGLDTIYPRSHHQLAKRILAQGGGLISEYPEGVTPRLYHFVARSRIVSGLSQALLITEAAHKGGSLHTANFALEQGRTVMVVPGNITNPNSQGTNLFDHRFDAVITSATAAHASSDLTEWNIELVVDDKNILTA